MEIVQQNLIFDIVIENLIDYALISNNLLIFIFISHQMLFYLPSMLSYNDHQGYIHSSLLLIFNLIKRFISSILLAKLGLLPSI
jgi:hypothetical protein